MPQSWNNLSDPIFHHAGTRPDAPPLVEGMERLSYGELAALVGAACIHLNDLGIAEDDRIGVALTNSIDHLVLSFALLRLGATLVEIPPEAGTEALAGLAAQLGLRTLFHETNAEIPPGLKSISIDIQWRSRLPGSGDLRSGRGADANQTIVLTSGSTGIPKGIIVTQGQWLARSAVHAGMYGERWSPDRPGRFLLTAPMSFGGFRAFVHTQLMWGGLLVPLPVYADRIDLVRAVAAEAEAVCMVTPNMCRTFLECADQNESPSMLLPRAQFIATSGLPLFGAEKQAMLERVTPHFGDQYGASGIGPIALLCAEDIMAKPDSVGRPVAGIALEIVDADGAALAAGAVGHIRCRFPGQTPGAYAGNYSAVAGEGYRDGWYHPGDIGRIDPEGFLHLSGRVSDVIRRNGHEIYPSEIEEAIGAMPLVAEVIAVGRPAADGNGEEAVVFIVARGDIALADLMAQCEAKLAPERRPVTAYFTKHLPKTPGGKIDRALAKQSALLRQGIAASP